MNWCATCENYGCICDFRGPVFLTDADRERQLILMRYRNFCTIQEDRIIAQLRYWHDGTRTRGVGM